MLLRLPHKINSLETDEHRIELVVSRDEWSINKDTTMCHGLDMVCTVFCVNNTVW